VSSSFNKDVVREKKGKEGKGSHRGWGFWGVWNGRVGSSRQKLFNLKKEERSSKKICKGSTVKKRLMISEEGRRGKVGPERMRGTWGDRSWRTVDRGSVHREGAWEATRAGV